MKQLKIGLQLYSVRKDMEEDLENCLKQVKAMGYNYVELAGGRYGKSGKEMKSLMDACGLTCISIHQSSSYFLANREDALSFPKELGVSFVALPCPTGKEASFASEEISNETFALYREMAREFKKEGIQLLYHNHDFEFKLKDENGFLFHRIFREVEDLLPEPDTCWASCMGIHPAKLLSEYEGKVPVVHLKDYSFSELPKKPMWKLLESGELPSLPPKRSAAGFRYAPIGEGTEEWENVICAAREAGSEYLIVEQDDSYDESPLKTAQRSRNYLKETFGL